MRKPVLYLGIGLVGVVAIGFVAVRGAMSNRAGAKPAEGVVKVERGPLVVSVVESGSIDAITSVELKSRVTGRLAQLFVEEGDLVRPGDLIAVIDPKETALRVEQDEAQLSGAVSGVQRLSLEIEQRRKTAQAAFNQAKARVAQLDIERKTQPTLTQAAITQAETALRSAEQDKERLVGSAHPTQRSASEAAVNEAVANLENAKREYERQQELRSKGYVAGRVAESAKLSYDLAQVRLDNARIALSRLDSQFRSELSKADEQIRQAQAELTRARANSIQNDLKREEYLSALAELEKARAALSDPAILAQQRAQSQSTVAQLRSAVNDSRRQLGETEIRAPIGGVVTKKGLQVGELATGLSQFSSGSTIVKIEDRAKMRVKLDMNEIDVAKLRQGMTARIVVDALPTETFTGVVSKIAPASKESPTGGVSNDAVVRYEVEISVTNPTPSLRSGMSAKCTVDVVSKTDVLVLPSEYVEKAEGKFYVYTPAADPKGKPVKHEIKVGAQSGAKIEIISGIDQGATVTKPPYTGPDRKGMMQMGPDEE